MGTKQEKGDTAKPLWIQCFCLLPPQHTASCASSEGGAVLQDTHGLHFSNCNKMFLDFSSDIWHLILHGSKRLTKR